MNVLRSYVGSLRTTAGPTRVHAGRAVWWRSPSSGSWWPSPSSNSRAWQAKSRVTRARADVRSIATASRRVHGSHGRAAGGAGRSHRWWRRTRLESTFGPVPSASFLRPPGPDVDTLHLRAAAGRTFTSDHGEASTISSRESDGHEARPQLAVSWRPHRALQASPFARVQPPSPSRLDNGAMRAATLALA